MESNNDFSSIDFLNQHIQKTMEFYHPRCIDNNGGFYQFFKDNGEIYDSETRHLVSSTRFIFNYAMAYQAYKKPEYLNAVRHGLMFLRERHLTENGGYVWLLKGNQDLDLTNHCYGLAFVLLAYSAAYQAGAVEAKPWINKTFDLMEKNFWSEEDGLYKDEISADWQDISPYRGQNANMHSCEAMIMAFDATGDQKFLSRAKILAKNICQRQADLAQGQIWEHYDENWNIDWEYNKHDPKNLFRPWGFQPGHQTEWCKLLMMLNHRDPSSWMVEKAKHLFDVAWDSSWDHKNGGLCYGYDPQGNVCDGEKYFWVQAESFAAAAWLAKETNDVSYWDKYQALWNYSWEHMVDHEYGAWFRILTQENQAIDNCKSPAGKTDYHTMGACYEVIKVLKAP